MVKTHLNKLQHPFDRKPDFELPVGMIFIYMPTCYYIVSFNLIRPVVCKKKSKKGFQDGGFGCYLEFLINMILAHFDPKIVLMLQASFSLNPSNVWRDVKNGFLRWRLWWPSWNFDLLSFSYFVSTRPLMLLIKFQLNWLIIFSGDVQNMNSQYFPI